CRQRGRFAGASGSGDQNQAAWFFAQLGDDWRQIELLKRSDLEWNHTEDRSGRTALVEDVATKTRQALQAEREVEFQMLLEAMLLRVGQHAVSKLLGLGRLQGRHVQGLQMSVHAHLWRRVGGDVEVAASEFDHLL